MRSTSLAMGRVLGLLSLFLVVSVVAGALLAGLFVPTVAAAGGVTRASIDWFNDISTTLPPYKLQQQSQLLASDGSLIARFVDENRSEVPLNKISKDMQTAIIAIEDSRFRDHGGIDPVGLVRAAVTNKLSGGTKVQGASTLTQQYIKNLFLEQAVAVGDEKGARAAVAQDGKRKLLEIRAAINLEKELPKDEILRRYLNIAYFGNQAYGVQAAAERYFSIPASKLTMAQAALLAGMVQSPSDYNPLSSIKKQKQAALDRRNTVLDRLHELGQLPDKRWQDLRKTGLNLKPRTQASGCIAASHSLAYFCQYVRALIIQGSGPFRALGATVKERTNTLNRGGLKIVTTIDLATQDAAVRSLTKRVPIGDKSKAAAAAVTVEPGTGRVLAMTQNKKFATKSDASSTSINYSVDTDLGGASGMQTGSTFKAFTLAAYLKDGGSINDVIDGTVDKRPYSDFKNCDGSPLNDSRIYDIGNAEAGEDKPITVLQATKSSVNTAYVAMETKVPLCRISKLAENIGVHLAAPARDDCTAKAPLSTKVPDCHPSLTLGPFSISPLTMAEAYAAFAADGTYCPAWPIDKITGPDGKQVPVKKPDCNPDALDEQVAHGVTYALKQVISGGTAQNVWSGTGNVAGKTGTADDSSDTWFVGYTRQRATAVWVGYTVEPWQRKKNEDRSLRTITIGG
ncbi:MAG TPA: transglycosylase domain-containing protein, partial [Kineosporiaceae bacterium]|nr:transglycosylase domain-containing protein [Kineosporiaceae bacterium]